MVAPVTGPFVDTVFMRGTPTTLGFKPMVLEKYRHWRRQKRPYNLPLEFTYRQRYIKRIDQWHSIYGAGSPSGTYYVEYSTLPEILGENANLYNKVYSKFKEGCTGKTATLAVTFAERRKSLEMIANRLVQLTTFARKLRKFDFRGAAKTLSCPLPPKKGRRLEGGGRSGGLSKDFSNNYLEFHFGWVPLVTDIYRATQVLSREFPSVPIHARVTGTLKFPISNSTVISGNDKYVTSDNVVLKQTYSIRAQVSVNNPNLALATELGLTNPALVAWEVIPFSFVLDWFVNVSDFLSSYTDFHGLNLINPSRTYFNAYIRTNNKFDTYNMHAPVNGTVSGRFTSMTGFIGEAIYCERRLGIPGPTLQVRDPWVLSPRRGLAAISLLLQRMR